MPNELDCYVTDVVRCEKCIDDDKCCWEVEVLYTCWSEIKRKKIFQVTSKKQALAIQPGYKFGEWW